MDLSFSRFDRTMPVAALPADLALLMVEMAARQAASPTAVIHARSLRAHRPETLLAPPDGAFNAAVARALQRAADG